MTLDPVAAALIVLAGVAGGIANALAGGGTLITFPAFLAAGLPPVTANATNALASWPGHAAAAWAERDRLPALLQAPGRRREALLMVLGGAGGAALLLASGDRLFLFLVPPLLALATLLFALRERVSGRGMPNARGGAAGLLGHPAATLGLATYAGYFHAGLGVMMMAWVSVRLPAETPAADANLLKNALSALATTAGVVLLAGAGVIAWGAAALGFAGAVAGGWLGGRMARRLPERWISRCVLLVGVALTAVSTWKIYL